MPFIFNNFRHKQVPYSDQSVSISNNIDDKKLYSNIFYHKYAKDIYSQNGEDGIIEELLNRLHITSGWVCEFGAWDGIHLSNTFNLIKNKNFSAVLIEGDSDKFKDLLSTQKMYPTIIAINKYVDYNITSNDTLDKILQETEIPSDFDILSIDIDSYDYHVWESVKLYNPKIVIIEIESSISPSETSHFHNPPLYQGTSFLPTYKLGIEKGYTFVLHTGNMFFVRNDLYNQLNITYQDPLENFRTNWLQN